MSQTLCKCMFGLKAQADRKENMDDIFTAVEAMFNGQGINVNDLNTGVL